MALFNFGKKQQKTCCCQQTTATTPQAPANTTDEAIGSITVLGAGCDSCHQQYENVQKALDNLGMTLKAEYISDPQKVMAYGIMSLPAIAINGRIAVCGKVLSVKEVEKLLENRR